MSIQPVGRLRLSSVRPLPGTARCAPPRRVAFTLVELLATAGVLAVLAGLAISGIHAARIESTRVACSAHARQLGLANLAYSQDQHDCFCPGALNFLENLTRWHGARPTPSAAFTPEGGALTTYLGDDPRVRACPGFEPSAAGFETSSGGYGYNNDFVGVQLARASGDAWQVSSDLSGALIHQVARPAETLMFADAALVTAGGVIEYSFGHARFQPASPGLRFDPSIHFRHGGAASISWCDGHVDRQVFSFTWSSGIYGGDPALQHIGWFGNVDDNGYFDLQ